MKKTIRRTKTFSEKLESAQSWKDIVKVKLSPENNIIYEDVLVVDRYSPNLQPYEDIHEYLLSIPDEYSYDEIDEQLDKQINYHELYDDIKLLLTDDEYLVFVEVTENEYSYRYAEKQLTLSNGKQPSYEKIRRIYNRAKAKILDNEIFINKYGEMYGR